MLNTFWLIQGAQVSLPLGSVRELAISDELDYVELADSEAKPPADANPDNDMIDARAQIRSDPYFNLGQTAGWIGLLDTGVRESHVVFNGPDHISLAQDVTGDGNPGDQCDHGTASAAEITGNSALGGNWRGASAISVDSFDVYGNDCGANTGHAVEGFQRAVSWLDKVIVAELQINSGEASAVSQAADAAFNSGSVVISANGNFGPGPGSVRSPGNAHKSVGIGAADLQTDALMSYSGRGPSTDGRFKPDLVFPTNNETARAGSNTAMGSFGGTSAATPLAGGAAALMRNWMRGGTGSLDAGHVYSHMILGGQTTYPFNNDTGAGPFQLGVNGHAWWGKTNVAHLAQIDIPINVAPGKTLIEGALWWPEATSGHNDVDLYLVAPDGTVRDSSYSGLSVFERAGVSTGVYAGTWKLRIKGYSVERPAEDVLVSTDALGRALAAISPMSAARTDCARPAWTRHVQTEARRTSSPCLRPVMWPITITEPGTARTSSACRTARPTAARRRRSSRAGRRARGRGPRARPPAPCPPSQSSQSGAR